MIKQLWTRFENISHWVVLVCFVIAFIPGLPSWIFLPLFVFAAPAFIAMNLKEDRDRRQRVYDRGFKDGQDSAKNQNK